MRISTIGLAGLAAATMFVVGGSQSVHAEPQNTQAQAQEPKIVIVNPGDTLSKIATAHETTYPRIFDANLQIKDPDVIYAGDNLRIPRPDEQLENRIVPAAAPAAVAPKPMPVQSKAPSPKPQAAAAKPKAAQPVSASAAGDDVWDRLAKCESGGNWAINTGNGYYGGLQFTPGSWRAAGGSGLPHQASREEQIARGKILQSKQGWGAWPACTRKLGIR